MTQPTEIPSGEWEKLPMKDTAPYADLIAVLYRVEVRDLGGEWRVLPSGPYLGLPEGFRAEIYLRVRGRAQGEGVYLVIEGPSILPEPLATSYREVSMSDTEARVSLLESTVKNLAAFVASLPQAEIKPLPGIDLWQYHQELWKQVHGDKASGYDLSRYEYYTNPAFAAQVANNEDYKLWTAARKANIVPDSPAGLFLLLYLSGEGYEHAEKVVGGENGKRFVNWLLAYRGYPAPR